MRSKIAVAALALGLSGLPMPDWHRDAGGSLSVTAGQAAAQTYRAEARRVSRRTARRTDRRHDYLTALPPNCVVRGVYHYCGGVYYQPVQQNGTTVYVVVNP